MAPKKKTSSISARGKGKKTRSASSSKFVFLKTVTRHRPEPLLSVSIQLLYIFWTSLLDDNSICNKFCIHDCTHFTYDYIIRLCRWRQPSNSTEETLMLPRLPALTWRLVWMSSPLTPHPPLHPHASDLRTWTVPSLSPYRSCWVRHHPQGHLQSPVAAHHSPNSLCQLR